MARASAWWLPAAILILSLIAWTMPAAAGGLRLAIEGVRNDKGLVRVAICGTEACYRDRTGFAVSIAPSARAGTVMVELPDLEPGAYTVMLFHDEDGDNEFDQNFLGLPREGFGFSNNRRPFLAPPAYDSVRIDIGPGGLEHAITVLYWD